MPDLDSGHIFLTTLAPIRQGNPPEGHSSYRQKLRQALVELPTAQQSPATVKSGLQSPFARNLRTHLARMFVLDNVIYNGREGHDAIWSSVQGALGNKDAANPAIPQHIDALNCAYLVFCADVDAVTKPGDPLPTTLSEAEQAKVRRSYAEELWETMGEELAEIYANCEGFDGIDSARGFADYLEKCHVETTMPFHDYYISDVSSAFHRLAVKPLAALVLVPALVTLWALLVALFGSGDMPVFGGNPIWTVLCGGVLTALAFWFAVRYAIFNGEKPLPPGEYDDLPSVLKALYVQQRFADLAIEMQGASDDEIHAAFATFLEQTQPDNRFAPTQAPGVIHSTGA